MACGRRHVRVRRGSVQDCSAAIWRVKSAFSLQMIESDLLDEAYVGNTLEKGNEWRNGVEVNEWGRPVRYAILTRHPGDTWFKEIRLPMSSMFFASG